MKSNKYKLTENLTENGSKKIIARVGDFFYLSGGFYYREDDSIIIESCNKTRRVMEFKGK